MHLNLFLLEINMHLNLLFPEINMLLNLLFLGNQYAPQPAPSIQLPVITSQSGATSVPIGNSIPLHSLELMETIRFNLGEYASIENANALINHMQALKFPLKLQKEKAADGSKIIMFIVDIIKITQRLSMLFLNLQHRISLGAIIVKISQQNTNVP